MESANIKYKVHIVHKDTRPGSASNKCWKADSISLIGFWCFGLREVTAEGHMYISLKTKRPENKIEIVNDK